MIVAAPRKTATQSQSKSATDVNQHTGEQGTDVSKIDPGRGSEVAPLAGLDKSIPKKRVKLSEDVSKTSGEPKEAPDAAVVGAEEGISKKKKNNVKLKVADSTAGEPEEVAIAAGVAEEEVSEKKKTSVKLKKSVLQRIRSLNTDGGLLVPLRVGAVAGPLSWLSEEDALSVLDTLTVSADEGGGMDVEDPTAWIVAAAEGAAEQTGWEEDQWAAWDEKETQRAGDLVEALPAAVVERVHAINRSVNLVEPLRLATVAGPLAAAGEKQALKVLDIVEKKAGDLECPSTWVRSFAYRRAGAVMARVDQLNRGTPGQMDLLARIVMDEVRDSLAMVPEEEGLQILKELADKAIEVEDPTAWVKASALERASPLGKRLDKLNKSGRLKESVNIHEAMKVLSGLDAQAAARVVGKLESRADIRKPTGWIFAEVARMTEQAKEVEPPGKGKKRQAKDPDDEGVDKYRRKGGSALPKGKGKDGAGKGKAIVGKDSARRTAVLGPMADAAPCTPPSDDENPWESSAAKSASGVTEEQDQKEEQEEAPLDPGAAAAQEAAAWRELREAFGEEAVDEEDDPFATVATAAAPKQLKQRVGAAVDPGGDCDDGEGDEGEYDDGECGDDDMQ